VARLRLTAESRTLVADGVSSTTITATLEDSLGRPAPDGLTVTFTTDRGRFTIHGAQSITVATGRGTGTVRVPFLSEKDVFGSATIVAGVQGVTQTLQMPLIAPVPQTQTPLFLPEKAKPSPEALETLVLRVQIALSMKGYHPGSFDGVLGPQTRAALQTFQRDQGIPATGRMETATLDALGIKLP
jgi:Putative peptidoglycan binding domain/Invasin, domain 3